MIDLRFPELPRFIVCEHGRFEVDTSFRTWIEFERIARECGAAWPGIFACSPPTCDDWVEAALEFLASPNATPSSTGGSAERAIDYILDGEYIAASFQSAYGIDLTCADMHWHRFKALLNGLPDDSKMAQIIAFRTYAKPPKGEDHDARMMRSKRAWALPDPDREAEAEALLAWAEANLP